VLASEEVLVISLAALDRRLAGLSLKVRECSRRLKFVEDKAKEEYELLLKYSEQLEGKWIAEILNKVKEGRSRLRSDVEYRIEIERKVIEEKMRGIREELAKLEEEIKRIHRKLRKEAEEMKKANPKLNEKEEKLKARRRKLSIKRGELLLRKNQLSKWIIGRILNRRLIRQIEREIRALDKEIEELDLKIYEVRTKWQNLKRLWESEKKEAEKAWAEIFVRMAELKQELIFYEDNLERLSLEGGVRRFIWDLARGFADPKDYEDPLISKCHLEVSKVIEEKKRMEGTIRDLSFARKVLLGFDRGIKRFRKPLNALRDEESRFPQLPELRIEYPEVLDSMSASLDKLLIALEESQDPESAAKAIRPLFNEDGPFSGENLKAFFDEIGQKVKLAVNAQWGR